MLISCKEQIHCFNFAVNINFEESQWSSLHDYYKETLFFSGTQGEDHSEVFLRIPEDHSGGFQQVTESSE